MSEITTEQLIKIILGIFVVVLVIAGVAFFFSGRVHDFIRSLPENSSAIKFWLSLI
jgi:hypothetical protein